MPKRKRNFRKKRPIAVSVIAMGIVVLFSIRLYQVIDPLIRSNVFTNGVGDPLLIGWQLTSLGAMLLTSASYLLLSLAGIIVLFGFLRLRRWSWVVLMAWTGISLVHLADRVLLRPYQLRSHGLQRDHRLRLEYQRGAADLRDQEGR